MIHLISTNDNPQPFLTEAEWAQLEQVQADNIASFTALLFACFGVGIIVGVIATILIHTVL